jgi:hypothetical protein
VTYTHCRQAAGEADETSRRGPKERKLERVLREDGQESEEGVIRECKSEKERNTHKYHGG